MSTRTTTTIVANDTDAHFRAWAQWIHDSLAAFGWVNTGDTGQINLATVLTPSGAGQSRGYEIWRMADTLQATKPVFMKLEYGSGSGAASHPGTFVTLGTGSDGAGNLTGNTITRQNISMPAGDTTARNSYASGDTNRFVFALTSDPATTQTNGGVFGVERTKATDGTDSTEGAYFFCNYTQGTASAAQMLTFSGTVPPQETLFLSPLQAGTTGVLSTDIYTWPIYPNGFYPRNPMMNAVTLFIADFTRETTFSLDFYGASHTYLPIGNPTAASHRASALDRINGSQLTRLAIRYE